MEKVVGICIDLEVTIFDLWFSMLKLAFQKKKLQYQLLLAVVFSIILTLFPIGTWSSYRIYPKKF